MILLSMANECNASTQVSHVEQDDKVTTTDGRGKRTCGFQGFHSIKENEEALRDLCGITLPVFCLLLNLLPQVRFRSTDVPREDRLCLFLTKMRLGISFNALGVIFGVAAKTASNSFKMILDVLCVALQDWVFVPSRQLIKHSLPGPFKVNYPNCTFIIDCTEIRTEMPSNPDQQHALYSHYKGGYTVKFLVGNIPNGLIAFISKVYGGRKSDAFITQDSGFIDLIEPGDLVLSDKGFPTIKTIIDDRGAVLLMPPFNSDGSQLSEQDMNSAYQIASVRVHVERVIQRLKNFRILSNRLPLTLLPDMDRVVSVCAALVNMQPSIIQEQPVGN